MVEVYSYDQHDRFFTRVEEAQICPQTGDTLVPANATTIAPPFLDTNAENQICVFSPEEEIWKIESNNFWHPTIIQRDQHVQRDLTGNSKLIDIPFHALMRYRSLPRLLSNGNIAISLHLKLCSIRDKIETIYTIHQQIILGSTPPDRSAILFHSGEELILHLKRFIDDIFVYEYIRLDYENIFNKPVKRLLIQGFNEISTLPAGDTKQHLLEIYASNESFLNTLRDMRNSLSHHALLPQSYNYIGEEHPSITCFYTKDGGLERVEIISEYIEDLVFSFNDFLRLIFYR